jgi:phosphoribosyl 1,2-cyclic phosphate phosphodiesterase
VEGRPCASFGFIAKPGYHAEFVRVTFLGTGTSHGVPMIGCDCDVCRSSDPRDNRLRSSIYVEGEGTALLVDTTTDLRLQALRADIRRVDAVLFTHSHADHVMGLDEVRRFNMLTRQPMNLYGTRETLDDLRRVFSYVFASDAPRGGGVPDLRLWPLAGPCCIGRLDVVPVPVQHGPWRVLGFRFGPFAYLTDCNGIPDSSLALLGGLKVLVLDALRHRRHPTHFSLEEAIAMAGRIGADQTYFTHIAHELGHAATCATLPAGMSLAYDGLVLEIPSSS